MLLITSDMMGSIKRSNVSKDTEKTMQRIKDGFLSAKNKVKTEIIELAGVSRASVYRVYREGTVSAKIVIAMAQILNVSPFYYTGEADEKDECNRDTLHSFLVKKGLRDLAYKITPGKSRDNSPKEPKANDTPAEENESKPNIETPGMSKAIYTSDFFNSPEFSKAAEELPLEEAQQLLTALYIRAKAGGNAAHIADIVRRCLLT